LADFGEIVAPTTDGTAAEEFAEFVFGGSCAFEERATNANAAPIPSDQIPLRPADFMAFALKSVA
jgi:hypothetical protein